MNYYEMAVDLLEKIANSVLERDPKTQNPLFFSVEDVKVVEEWLKEFNSVS